MQIPLAQLAQLAKILVDAYQERGVESVTVDDVDMYWIAQPPEWTDFSKPPELCVGSLVDDWESLRKVLAGEMATAVDFDRLAAVLRAVSEELSPRPPRNA